MRVQFCSDSVRSHAYFPGWKSAFTLAPLFLLFALGSRGKELANFILVYSYNETEALAARGCDLVAQLVAGLIPIQMLRFKAKIMPNKTTIKTAKKKSFLVFSTKSEQIAIQQSHLISALLTSVCTGKYCLRFLSHRPRSFVARSVRKTSGNTFPSRPRTRLISPYSCSNVKPFSFFFIPLYIYSFALNFLQWSSCTEIVCTSTQYQWTFRSQHSGMSKYTGSIKRKVIQLWHVIVR